MRGRLALIAATIAAVVVGIALPASAAQQHTSHGNRAQLQQDEIAAARHAAARVERERAVEARDRGCPLHALRLPPDAVAKAAIVARHFGANDHRTVIVASALAGSQGYGTRGFEARHQCGAATARRTVVVDLFYPWLLPSASLTQGTLFVSYFRNGYHVWEVAH